MASLPTSLAGDLSEAGGRPPWVPWMGRARGLLGLVLAMWLIIVTAPAVDAQATRTLRIFPTPPTLAPGDRIELSAWFCRLPPEGDVFGPDAMPGSADDACQPARGTRWSTEDQRIARVQPRRGTRTTLTGRRDGLTSLQAEYQATATSTFIHRVQVDVAEPIEVSGSDEEAPDEAQRAGPGAPVSIIVQPGFATLAPGDSQVFVAYACPQLGVGDPRGSDMLPGSGDDFCRPAHDAAWMALGDDPIGSLDPVSGFYTLLATEADEEGSALLASLEVLGATAASTSPEGSSPRSGAIVARVGDQEGGASVALDPSLEPREPVLLGDIDGDGDVDFDDVTRVLGSVGAVAGDADYAESADLDGNGTIDATDLLIFKLGIPG